MSSFVRGLMVAGAVAVSAVVVAAQDNKDKQTAEQSAEIRALLTITDEAATGKATSSLPLKWEGTHFIKSHGDKTYVPFTVSLDGSAFTAPTPVSLYLRVAKRGELPPTAAPEAARDDKKKDDKKSQDQQGQGSQVDARHEYPFEDVFFIDLPAPVAGKPHLLRRAFAVSPGDYDVYVAVKEKGAAPAAGTGDAAKSGDTAPADAGASAKIGVVKQELTVPSLDGELTTSSVIVAEKVDELQAPIPTDRQSEHPYTFGQMRIVPAVDGAFPKSTDLNVIFWIYGAGTDAATKKPNVQVDYNFHQKLPDGEKFFNRTEPTVMNAETLPPQFDLAAGHQLPGSLAVPLASFPEGEYRLEVKVTDKTSGKTITRDVPFTVIAQAQ